MARLVRSAQFDDAKNNGSEAIFAAKHLLTSKSLGDYIQFLEGNGAFSNVDGASTLPQPETETEAETLTDKIHSAIITATITDSPTYVDKFLSLSSNPTLTVNHNAHCGKIGKIKDRRERKKYWQSSAVHLASQRGNWEIVEILVKAGAKVAVPDASGNFPLHLAAGGVGTGMGTEATTKSSDEGANRIKCLQHLIQAGAIVTSRDANKHFTVHSAARGGQEAVLIFVIELFKNAGSWEKVKDAKDRWQRTPLHWAVLNGNNGCCRILVEMGAKVGGEVMTQHMLNRSRSSLVYETPLEIAKRLKNQEVKDLLEMNLI